MRYLAFFLWIVTWSNSLSEIRINEFMASNGRSFPDIVDFEDYPDWIELYNDGPETLSLENYHLSDNSSLPRKWSFPAGTSIPAEGYLVLIADGNDSAIGTSHPRGYWPWRNFTTDRIHTNFSLSSEGESLVLSKSTGVQTNTLIDLGSSWSYLDDGSDQGEPWKLLAFDDSSWQAGPAPLGYGDDPATTLSFGDTNDRHITSYLRRKFSIENPDDLESLSITMQVDDSCLIFLNGVEVLRHNLPDGPITIDTRSSISASPPLEDDFHTYSFGPSFLVPGENIIAVEVHQSSSTSVDMRFDLKLDASTIGNLEELEAVTFSQQVRDVSMGRSLNDPDTWAQFTEATPGEANNSSVVTNLRVSSPEVVSSLPAGLYQTDQSVNLSSPEGEIHYTLNGANPTLASPIYTVPLAITETTVIRARNFTAGKAPGPILSSTIFIGETFKNLPFVSLTADPETLFGEDIGIYWNSKEPNNEVYKKKDAPGHLEFFPNDGTSGFAVNGGIRIGGENNWASHSQKALNFALRGKYGDDEIKYDLFPGTGIPIHTAIGLREGGDNWRNAMLRDSLWWYLAADDQLKVDTSARRPVVAFLNGDYWGIYNMRDRWNEEWFHEHYGIDNGNYDHIGYGRFTSSTHSLGAHHGEITEWEDFYFNFLNVSDPSDPVNWAYIESQIDLDSYIDFVTAESYGCNTSWRHNREFWKERKPGAKWRWFVPDMDRTWQTGNLDGDVFSIMIRDSGTLRRLKLNADFRARLAQRIAAHTASTFAPERINALMDELGPLLEPELERHVERWDNAGTTLERYADQIQEIRTFANNRGPIIIDQVRETLDLDSDIDLTLAVEGEGRILFAGVSMTPTTFNAFPNLKTTIEALPAPGYTFSHWTGIDDPAASSSITLNGNTSITAHFTPDTSTIVGGTLAQNTTWTASQSPYHITDDLIVPLGTTLTIDEGVTILMGKGRHLRVMGTLLVNGSAANPVTIEGRNDNLWGGVSFEEPNTPSTLNHFIVRDATRGTNPAVYPYAISGLNATIELNHIDIAECRGPLFFRGGSMILRDSFIHIPITGDGLNVKQGQAITERCTFLGNDSPDTDAIDYDGVIDGVIRDCRIYRFLGFNSDGIDTGEECRNVLLEGNRIYFNSDKGVSVGQGSTIIMRNNLIVGCEQGVGVKDTGSTITIDGNTFVDCAEAVAVYEKNFGAGGGNATVSNTIFSKCDIPVSVESYSTLTVNYSLSDTSPLPGANNLGAEPGFRDPLNLDFGLAENSIAINAGDPNHSLDPDGTVIDIGAIYEFNPLDYPFNDLNTVVINEILANSGSQVDWIELHNRTNADIDIGGWFLSDDGSNLKKYRIPPGTIIAANGFFVIFEDLNFGADSDDPNSLVGFALSATGETLHLTSAVNDTLSGYHFSEDYRTTAPGETIGYHFKPGTGTYNFVRLAEPTAGATNALPKNGPIVISELMYNVSGDEDAEYLELLNISNETVSLYDTNLEHGWRFEEGIDFEFPSGASINPGERIILTRNAAAFSAQFNAPNGTQIFQWLDGKLSNSGDTIELEKPGQLDDNQILRFIRIDRVNYSPESPWNPAADGTGLSLGKIVEHAYGNDATNWTALAPSPGASTTGTTYEDWAAGLPADGDFDRDGLSNLLEYALGMNPRSFDLASPFKITFDRDNIDLDLTLPLAQNDVAIEIQKSTNLVNWQTVELNLIDQTDDHLTIATSLPRNQGKEYYRLFVKKKP